MEPDSSLRSVIAARRSAAYVSALAATRESLLTRLKSTDDHDGWQRFFDTYGGVIHGLAVRSGLSKTEADDALQETLVSVAGEMPGFKYDRAKGSFKGWLFQIARRRIADQFRRRARRIRDGDDAGNVVEEAADVGANALETLWEDEWRENLLQLGIERVKLKVAAKQWQMFDLLALQDWPTEKICELLGVNRAQLYMAKMRVGRLLAAEVQALGADGPHEKM
jgi:RNA polymerase sigma factor (sigma-70 family)